MNTSGVRFPLRSHFPLSQVTGCQSQFSNLLTFTSKVRLACGISVKGLSRSHSASPPQLS